MGLLTYTVLYSTMRSCFYVKAPKYVSFSFSFFATQISFHRAFSATSVTLHWNTCRYSLHLSKLILMQCHGRGLAVQFCTHVLRDDLDRIALLSIDREKGRKPCFQFTNSTASLRHRSIWHLWEFHCTSLVSSKAVHYILAVWMAPHLTFTFFLVDVKLIGWLWMRWFITLQVWPCLRPVRNTLGISQQ